MIEVAAESDVKFTYAFVTSHGNISVSETSENLFEVHFQHRHATEDIRELLGTYRTLEEAVTAVSSGLTEQPEIEVRMSDLGISPDLFEWDRHFAGVCK